MHRDKNNNCTVLLSQTVSMLKTNLTEIGIMFLLAEGQYVLLTPANAINGKGVNLQDSLVVNIDHLEERGMLSWNFITSAVVYLIQWPLC